MKVHETRSHAHASGDEEKAGVTRKHKADTRGHEAEQSPKKTKPEQREKSHADSKFANAEFSEFGKAIKDHLSVQQMKEILEANAQETPASADEVVERCQDLLLYGPLDNCPVCNHNLHFDGNRFFCKGAYSEWSTCTFSTKDPPRKQEPTKLPPSVLDSPVSDMIKKYGDPSRRPKKEVGSPDKPFTGMMISLMGRLTRTHQYWRSKIERHGGKVANSILGATCLVASAMERERGGSSKLIEAMERGIPVVSEAWLADSIDKHEAQPMDAYDIVSDLTVYGKEAPPDTEEIIEELKLYGKRGVHKDSRLQERGGKIFEKDGILYNCAFTLCDLGQGLKDYCISQLISVPESNLHLYYKKGRIGDDENTEERVEEWENEENAIKEFVRIFEETTGNENEFEPWEREKKIQKIPLKFFPVDMDDGVEVRQGGLALRQLSIAVTHCKLEPRVARFMQLLCSKDIYESALLEMALDSPDIPIGMVTSLHLKRCEDVLLEFIEKMKSMKETGLKAEAIWSDFSQRWFTLMYSSRPFIFRDYQELADHAAAVFEAVRDVTVASHLIGDMSGATLDDPLSDRYKKLGCSVSPLEEDTDDYKMIVNYLQKTYEPVKLADIEYDVLVDNIFSVESNASPSLDEMKKLPNKVLLWCGTRSSNLLRHLHKGFLPAVCSLPVPGYMFGKAIICSDAAAEAARYGFTAVDRVDGFLVLAVVSLGDQVTEFNSPPKDTKSLEEKKLGVKGLGRKKTDESEHCAWKDDIKVPCGRLIPSDHKNSPLEYNEYAVYDPKQVSIRFLVGVRFEEKEGRMGEAK